MDFLERLRREAFGDAPPPPAAADAPDIPGWMDNAFVDALAAALGPDARVVVEVGTWLGRSACAAAAAAKGLGLAPRIVCVDTWLGAPEFWTWGLDDPTRGAALARVQGYPTAYARFRDNVLAHGHADVVCPLPLSSPQAADVLAYHGVVADAVYVDAAHEEAAVAADLAAYWALLRPGGRMLGDDYTTWPGVRAAVDAFAAARGLTPAVAGCVWWLDKPR